MHNLNQKSTRTPNHPHNTTRRLTKFCPISKECYSGVFRACRSIVNPFRLGNFIAIFRSLHSSCCFWRSPGYHRLHVYVLSILRSWGVTRRPSSGPKKTKSSELVLRATAVCTAIWSSSCHQLPHRAVFDITIRVVRLLSNASVMLLIMCIPMIKSRWWQHSL